MYDVVASSRFKKDLKLAIKRGLDISLLDAVVTTLQKGESLPAKNKDHALTGNYTGCRECHIQPDWLLIYEISDKELILYLTRTGSHSDLF
ncbi:MAG: type II toxin-antitoxin system YafQ family toxin [Spirochaetaceae bacterium]|nr:type II toxin-antitoxin system YafQ family toxin [Spirochaetaceae bacterium]